MEGNSKNIFWGFTIAGCIVGVTIALLLNSNISILGRSCDINYSPCVPQVSYDLDCADIGIQVTVKGADIYRFDRDGDGYGCESYHNENLLWPVIIYGAAGAWIGGWAGLFISMAYEHYEGKKKKKE